MKHNNALVSNHFNKGSMKFKTWFDQPAKRQKRRAARREKAKKRYPIPVKKLLPVVRQPTQRHNYRVRLGRGFTEQEIVGAGIEVRYAMSIGVKVDKRRKDRNTETYERNVERLKEYLKHVKVYKNAKEAREDNAKSFIGTIMPVKNEKPVTKFVNVADINSYVEAFEG
ncbi:60S Ribosomal protein L13 [Trachipleistophora hominis]|uniref:60S Ribosomal protein L13 n=1 Tax=Trachipleistophora hominis TaxID=72359 RepID=L7JVK6_TRAHO|nr:60S Ribosomal protein L13 [Trachipleistophora hominis]